MYNVSRKHAITYSQEAQGNMSAEVAHKPASVAEWKKAATHPVRLPSGVYIGLKIPDLAALIEADHIPQNLLDAALSVTGGEQAAQKPTKEFILQEKEFTDRLVLASVVQPKISESDLPDLPFPDKVMIVEIATRQRDLDAEGNHIGGLHKSAAFRSFRGLDEFDTDLED